MNKAKKKKKIHTNGVALQKELQQILLLWKSVYGKVHKNLDRFLFLQKKGIKLLTGLASF